MGTGLYYTACNSPKSGTFIMGRRIPKKETHYRWIVYTNGDKIGKCIFIKEIDGYISPSGKKNRRAMFQCLKCNNIFEATIQEVKREKTTSCGCRKGNCTHGLTDTPIHFLWRRIKKRCYNENDKSYKWYGARGIIMYGPWIKDFKAFYDYVTQLPHYGEAGVTLNK